MRIKNVSIIIILPTTDRQTDRQTDIARELSRGMYLLSPPSLNLYFKINQ